MCIRDSFYYGFTIDNNQDEVVYLKLYLNSDDPYLKFKENMLGIAHGQYIKQFTFREKIDNNFDHNNKMLGYLRFIEYDEDFNHIGKYFKTCKADKRKLRMPVMSIRNEKKMLTKLKTIAEKCLSKFPQSYEEDMKMLESAELSFNERNCLVFRAGEKQIYRLMISMATFGLTVLSKNAKSLKINLKDLIKTTPFGSYIKKCLIPLTGSWK
eukprot:TRINITY_DN10986_c0_g1_i12.p1 TRINITY_DN10986_c0_g1~~TRINITY_DN10986_c0_g1_i12.p1  ORF type:complete len:211 (+),score=66.64 TRINITY_DN10986_c0_g1_i12:76-708(+)